MSHLFVLVLALVWTVVQCSCPTMCRCKNFATDALQTDFYTVASCTGIPKNISSQLTHKLQEITLLGINESSLEIIISQTIHDLPSLKRLSLKNTNIFPTNISISSNITYLDLSENDLDIWTDIINAESLKVLDISKNQFSVLQNYSFRTMNNLEVLNISFNNISVIESETFYGLDNLKCLDLSGNAIDIFTHNILLPTPTLQYLNLSRNSLNTLSEFYFTSLSKLQQLDLSWNKLQKVAPGSLELPSLTRLLLSGNYNLGKTGDASILVSTGRKLQTVDASNIGLQQVPPSLTPSIRMLKLSSNNIQNINCGDLDSYPLLQMLDFASNDISFIEEDALGRLDSLTMLFLTDNKIREIPKSLPEKLEVLRIDQNELDRISDGDLQGLTKLEVLLLNDNKIRIIEAKAFAQLASLVTLDLSKNPVSVLQAGCLLGPISLQVLRLSGIELISPAKDVSFPLSAPEHLITLDLSNSPGLARQFLADTAVLAASKQLQELDLSNTNLDVLRSDLLHYLPQLRSLHLDENKLDCSNLRWLASWLRKQDEKKYRKIICASPAELWGTLLTDLQDGESEMPETITEWIKTTSQIQSATSNEAFIGILTRNITVEANLHRMNISAESTTTDYLTGETSDVNTDPIHAIGNSETKYNAASTSNELVATIPTLNSISYETNEINSGVDEAQNSTPIRRGNGNTGIRSKTIYTKVTNNRDSATSEKRQKPRIKTSSSYTKVMDMPIYHRNGDAYREKSTTLFVNIVPNMVRHWNGTADELSSVVKDVNKNSVHPGMIILFIGVLGATAVIVMFTSKFTRKVQIREDRDIEVNSLPSVTELW